MSIRVFVKLVGNEKTELPRRTISYVGKAQDATDKSQANGPDAGKCTHGLNLELFRINMIP